MVFDILISPFFYTLVFIDLYSPLTSDSFFHFYSSILFSDVVPFFTSLFLSLSRHHYLRAHPCS